MSKLRIMHFYHQTNLTLQHERNNKEKKEIIELNRESNLMGQENGLSNPGGLDFMTGFLWQGQRTEQGAGSKKKGGGA